MYHPFIDRSRIQCRHYARGFCGRPKCQFGHFLDTNSRASHSPPPTRFSPVGSPRRSFDNNDFERRPRERSRSRLRERSRSRTCERSTSRPRFITIRPGQSPPPPLFRSTYNRSPALSNISSRSPTNSMRSSSPPARRRPIDRHSPFRPGRRTPPPLSERMNSPPRRPRTPPIRRDSPPRRESRRRRSPSFSRRDSSPSSITESQSIGDQFERQRERSQKFSRPFKPVHQPYKVSTRIIKKHSTTMSSSSKTEKREEIKKKVDTRKFRLNNTLKNKFEKEMESFSLLGKVPDKIKNSFKAFLWQKEINLYRLHLPDEFYRHKFTIFPEFQIDEVEFDLYPDNFSLTDFNQKVLEKVSKWKELEFAELDPYEENKYCDTDELADDNTFTMEMWLKEIEVMKKSISKYRSTNDENKDLNAQANNSSTTESNLNRSTKDANEDKSTSDKSASGGSLHVRSSFELCKPSNNPLLNENNASKSLSTESTVNKDTTSQVQQEKAKSQTQVIEIQTID